MDFFFKSMLLDYDVHYIKTELSEFDLLVTHVSQVTLSKK